MDHIYNVNSRFPKNMRKHSKAIRMSLFSGHDRFHVVITCPGTNAIGKNRLTGSTLPDRHIVVVNRIQWLEGSLHGYLVHDRPFLCTVVRGGGGGGGGRGGHLCVGCSTRLKVTALLVLEGVEWTHGVEEAVVQHHTRQACKEHEKRLLLCNLTSM